VKRVTESVIEAYSETALQIDRERGVALYGRARYFTLGDLDSPPGRKWFENQMQ